MNEKQKTTLVHAINHFGVERQINKAVEEMGELITELSRRNLAWFDKNRVAEEIADALIMLEQLRIIFGASQVDGCIAEKLERLEDTINGDLRRKERMMPKGMVKHRKESEARKGSLIGECIEAGLMAGLKSIDPDLAEKVAKAPAVFIPAEVISGYDSMGILHNCPEPSVEELENIRRQLDEGIPIVEGAAAASKKRRTTNGDPVEAAFHGEVWARCRLCGKAYEQQSEVKWELPGESYCPWCNGYGKEDGSHE